MLTLNFMVYGHQIIRAKSPQVAGDEVTIEFTFRLADNPND
jgi:hypothetical protein